MDWKINFSKEAKKRTKEILAYLSEEWSVKSAQNFTNVLDNKIKNILLFPRSFSSIEDKPYIR